MADAAAPATTVQGPPAHADVPAQPQPAWTHEPITVREHFENLLLHIVPEGGDSRNKVLMLFRKWHDALVAELAKNEAANKPPVE